MSRSRRLPNVSIVVPNPLPGERPLYSGEKLERAQQLRRKAERAQPFLRRGANGGRTPLGSDFRCRPLVDAEIVVADQRSETKDAADAVISGEERAPIFSKL